MDMEIFLVKKYVIYIKSEMRANHSKIQREDLARPETKFISKNNLCRSEIKDLKIKLAESEPF